MDLIYRSPSTVLIMMFMLFHMPRKEIKITVWQTINYHLDAKHINYIQSSYLAMFWDFHHVS